MKINLSNLAKLKPSVLLDFAKKHQDLLLVFFVTGLALFLRLWKLDVIPPGFSGKESAVLTEILSLGGKHLWIGGNFFRGAYEYTAFIIFSLFGQKLIYLRLLSALVGTGTVLMTYVFISKWFSKQIAIFSAFLLSISAFHISLSRLIVPEVFLPFICLVLFSVLTDAYRKKSIWLFGIAGLLTGLGLYTSPAFMFIPVVFLISGLYFFLKNKKFVTAYKQELVVSLLGFVSVTIPFVVSFAHTPMTYLTNFGFNRSIWQIVMNIGQIPNMLFIGTQPNFFVNIGVEPLLDPFIFVTSILGFLLALFGLRRRKYFFIITWFSFFCLYAALKRGVQILDLVGTLPVIYTFSALVLDYVVDKWKTTFPYNKNAKLALVGLIAVFFALSTLYNFNRYFIAYSSSKEVKKEFSAHSPIPLK